MIGYRRPPEDTAFTSKAQKLRKRLSATGPFDEKVWQSHKSAFSVVQHGKCAYCDHYIACGQDGDVEHFAPMAGVQDIGADPSTWGIEEFAGLAKLTPGSRVTIPRSSAGYWWLAYDWSNFLFACLVCNRKYKRTVFPLVPVPSKRWRPSKRSKRHVPLLLNCFDARAPWRNFRFDKVTNAVSGTTPQGVATIATCGLHRETLRSARGQAVGDARRMCDDIQDRRAGPRARLRAWHDLVGLGSEERSFAGAVRATAEESLGLRWEEIAGYARTLLRAEAGR